MFQSQVVGNVLCECFVSDCTIDLKLATRKASFKMLGSEEKLDLFYLISVQTIWNSRMH